MTLDAWYRRLSNNKSRNDYAYEVGKIETLGGSLTESAGTSPSRTPSVTMAILLQGARENNGETLDAPRNI